MSVRLRDYPRPLSGWPRRRFLICAAASLPAWRTAWAAGPKGQVKQWSGIAFGTRGRILLAGGDTAGQAVMEQAVDRCVEELRRLENQFSLFDNRSALSRLNAAGVLDPAPDDLIALLRFSRSVSDRTGGAFDPTVQPLWRLYADHFDSFRTGQAPETRQGTEGDTGQRPGPPPAAVAAARRLVDWRGVLIEGRRIRLARPGMALTLNGIAQGFAADRLTTVLRGFGLRHLLVDVGEQRALGPREDGRPWRIGIVDPRRSGRLLDQPVELDGGALAGSGGYGHRFDAAGRWHHLFDPVTGDSARDILGVSVRAPLAVEADAYATAFAVMPPARTRRLAAADRRLKVILTHADGRVERLGA